MFISFVTLFFAFQVQANYFNLLLEDWDNLIVMLEDTDSGQCFQLQSGSATNGERIELGDCDQVDQAQQFYVTKRSDGSYKFVSMLDKQLCVDAVRRVNGAIILWNCHPDNSPGIQNQKVFIDEIAGNAKVKILFKNNASVTTYAHANQNDKIMKTVDENSAITWDVLIKGKDFDVSLDDLDNAILLLKANSDRQCFQLKNGEAVNGNTIELADCNQKDVTQQFYATKRSDGSYKLVSMLDKRLCVDAVKKLDGAIVLWTCHPDNSPSIKNQKAFIDRMPGESGMTISFRREYSNIITGMITITTPREVTTYVRVDGNAVKQTILGMPQFKTLWDISLPIKDHRFIVINQMTTDFSIICDKTQITLSPNQTAFCHDIVEIPQWTFVGGLFGSQRASRIDEALSKRLKDFCGPTSKVEIRIAGYLNVPIDCL